MGIKNFIMGLGFCIAGATISCLTSGPIGAITIAKKIGWPAISGLLGNMGGEFSADELQNFIAYKNQERSIKKAYKNSKFSNFENLLSDENFQNKVKTASEKGTLSHLGSIGKMKDAFSKSNLDNDNINAENSTATNGNKGKEAKKEFKDFYKLFTAYPSTKDLIKAIEKTAPYKELTADEKEIVGDIIDVLSKDILAYTFNDLLTPSDQAIIQIILSGFYDIEDDINASIVKTLQTEIEKIFARAITQSGGISFNEIKMDKYIVKYLPMKCPQCGYSGRFIHVYEKTSYINCGACGKRSQIMKGLDIEDCKELRGKQNEILKNQIDTKKELVKFREQFDKIADEYTTKEFLESCLKNQTKDFFTQTDKLKNGLENVLNSINDKLSNMGDDADKIKELLNTKIDEDKKSNELLCRHVQMIGKDINRLFDYAKKHFEGTDIKLDLVLDTITNMCIKEYIEEQTKMLGSNINEVIQKCGSMENQMALTNTSLAQIMYEIKEWKTKCELKDGDGQIRLDTVKLEERLHEENKQLCGKISSMRMLIEDSQELIKKGSEENARSFRKVLEAQEAQTTTILAAFSQLRSEDIKKIYRGGLPSKYLVNEGFGGAFPCPYCGVEEERKINADHYCKCNVCGEKFYGVLTDSETIQALCNEFGFSENDPLLPSENNIRNWKKRNTGKIFSKNLRKLLEPEGFKSDTRKIVIIPEDAVNYYKGKFCDGFYIPEDLADKIKILILPANLCNVDIDGKSIFVTNDFKLLETIIFSSKEFDGKTIYVRKGKENIKVYIKQASENGIEVKSN